MKKSGFFLLMWFFSATIYSQNFDEVVIRTEKITESIYMLEGSGGNIGVLVGEDGVFMIDDQYAPLSEKISKAISEISEHPVKFLVNTHWHGDHTGGNENFGKAGAIIVAHNNVRKRLSTDQIMKAFNRNVPAAPDAAWPIITFEQDINFYLNEEDVMIFHVHKAHTDGDAFVWFPKSNVLHMGDCFFKDRFPFVDLGSGGSINGAIKAVEAALMLSDNGTKIIPGHGTLAGKSDLLRYYTMLMTLRDRVKNAIAAGKSIEEIKAAGLDDGYKEWGKGFISADRFIDTIWTDMNREN